MNFFNNPLTNPNCTTEEILRYSFNLFIKTLGTVTVDV